MHFHTPHLYESGNTHSWYVGLIWTVPNFLDQQLFSRHHDTRDRWLAFLKLDATWWDLKLGELWNLFAQRNSTDHIGVVVTPVTGWCFNWRSAMDGGLEASGYEVKEVPGHWAFVQHQNHKIHQFQSLRNSDTCRKLSLFFKKMDQTSSSRIVSFKKQIENKFKTNNNPEKSSRNSQRFLETNPEKWLNKQFSSRGKGLGLVARKDFRANEPVFQVPKMGHQLKKHTDWMVF